MEKFYTRNLRLKYNIFSYLILFCYHVNLCYYVLSCCKAMVTGSTVLQAYVILFYCKNCYFIFQSTQFIKKSIQMTYLLEGRIPEGNRFRPLTGDRQVLIVLLYCKHVLFFSYLVDQSCLRLLLCRPMLSCPTILQPYAIFLPLL